MRFLALAMAMALFGADGASADGRVNLCGTDAETSTAPGALNLKTALTTGGRVTFDCPPGTVMTITTVHLIDQATEIDGENKIVLDAKNVTSMFDATNGGSPFEVSNITLRDGPSATGFPGTGAHFAGLIFGPITVRLNNVNVEATAFPIAANSVEISGGRFTGNTGTIIRAKSAAIGGGAEFVDNDAVPLSPLLASPAPGLDGLITDAVAAVDDARFTRNRHIMWVGKIRIKRGTFNGNGRGARTGGALWLSGEGVIEKSAFLANQAVHGGAVSLEGGKLAVRHGIFVGNKAEQSGGAISVAVSGAIHLTYSKFEENGAALGGALSLAHSSPPLVSLTGKLVHFARNEASISGGAINSEDANIRLQRVVMVDNRAAVSGGAINATKFDRGDSTELGNALIVRNSAPLGGGYVGAKLLLINSTVADNQVGGGIRGTKSSAGQAGPPTVIDLRNTIVSNNTGGNCPLAEDGPFTLNGFNNIQNPGTQCGTAIMAADPQLDGFYVPGHRSPARNAGNNDACSKSELVAARDVYGEARPEGTNCTIGAVEGDLEHHVLVEARKHDEGSLPRPIRDLLSYLGIERYPEPRPYVK